MNISQQLDEIIKLLSESGTSNYIAIVSVVVAILALLANIITNRKNHKQYIESLKPLLTFDFYEINGELLLSVTNSGKTEANNIRLEILQMRNNGNNNNLILDGLFENKFMLFPEEEVQGTIGHYGGNVQNKCFPIVDVKISYHSGNDNKTTEYIRTITFKRNIYGRNQFSKIEDSIESISYSNNRLANYIEGRTLFRFDKMNTFPHNSLYKDMRDAFNNIERKENENNNLN